MNINEIMNKYTKEQIEEIKNNALEMKTYGGERLKDVVLKLEQLRRNNQINYYADFNGYKLYSIDVTMDKAYKEVIGCTKRTWNKRMQKKFEDNRKYIEESKKTALERLHIVIENGKKYIHSEKINKWTEFCQADAEGTYCGLITDNSLVVMQALEDNKPYEEIREIIDSQGHSGYSQSLLMHILLLFAKDGPKFYRYMRKGHMGKYEVKYVSKIRKLNMLLKNGKSYSDAKESLKDHKIYEISISYDPNNIGDFSNDNYKTTGTILVNDDGTFEGIINDHYSYGNIQDNDNISFAVFPMNRYEVPLHYFGIQQGNRFIGLSEKYLSLYACYKDLYAICNASINLVESDKDFNEEINITKNINEMKKKYNYHIKREYNLYIKNEDFINKKSLYRIQSLLEEKLVGLLYNEIDQDKLKEEAIQKRLERKLNKSKNK